jgi:hypothetical protein
MRTPEQIIIEIKTFISSSKLFRFTNSEKTILNLLNELENTLNPQPIVEEPVVAEQNVLIKDEDGLFEEVTFIEEPIVAKKSTKKK